MARFKSALLMLGNAVLAFLVTWLDGRNDEALAFGLLYGAALGGLATLLAVRPRGIVLTLSRGVAAGLLLITCGLVLLQMLLGGMGGSSSGIPLHELLTGAAVVVIQVELLKSLPLEGASRSRSVAMTLSGMIGAAFLLLLLTCGGTLAGSVVELALLIPRVQADSVMNAAVPRVQACAVAFARQHGGAYPPSLAAMGPGPGGAGCLDAEHAAGRVGRVRLTYVPGAPDAAGRITAYSALAQGRVGLEHGEARMVYGDESGVVRKGDSVAVPGALPVLHGGMKGIRAARACAELYRAHDSAAAYPQEAKVLYNVPQLTGADYEAPRRLGCFPSDIPSFDPATHMWNVATYTPVGGPEHPTDYVLEIRPRVYGVHGVRSLRTTARGVVHATVENRAATDQDPVVPPCAYELGDASCAPAPGGVPAAVEILAPDTVQAGDSFTVTFRDRRSAAETDRPYQYHLMCNYRRYVDPSEPPAAYTFEASGTCVADPNRSLDGGRVVVVLVWVRDHAGAVSSVERRVGLRRPAAAE